MNEFHLKENDIYLRNQALHKIKDTINYIISIASSCKPEKEKSRKCWILSW